MKERRTTTATVAADPAPGMRDDAQHAREAGPMEPIKRRPLLVDEVLTRMRQAIVQGDWDMGEKISEARVAASFGTSKSPVREALLQLKREGLVEIRPQAGTFVFTLAPGELGHICEMRLVLEAAALRRVFEIGAHDELEARLAGVRSEMEAAWRDGDVRRYLDLDGQFHHAICESCGNPYIVQSYGMIEGKVAALRTRLGTDPHHMKKSFDEHQRIADLVASANRREALDLLGRHIARKEGSYWEYLSQTSDGQVLKTS